MSIIMSLLIFNSYFMLKLLSSYNFNTVEKIKKLEELIPWTQVKINKKTWEVDIFIKSNSKNSWWYWLWWNIKYLNDIENSIQYAIWMMIEKNSIN